MENEYFLSGYCRVNDQSRTVGVEFTDGVLSYTDCCYPDCSYTDRCTIAKQIKELEDKNV